MLKFILTDRAKRLYVLGREPISRTVKILAAAGGEKSILERVNEDGGCRDRRHFPPDTDGRGSACRSNG
jgi:hypothetical protein